MRSGPARLAPTQVEPESAPLETPFMLAFYDLFDAEVLWESARRLGVVERVRKLNLPELVRSTVTALSGPVGTQTTILTSYLEHAEQVAPSSFYAWFTPEYAHLMMELAVRAAHAVREVEERHGMLPAAGSLLERMGNVAIVDGSSVLLSKLARTWGPATSKQRGGIKLTSVVSLGSPLPTQTLISAQSTHENRMIRAEDFDEGALVLYDLGFVDHEREIDMFARGTRLLRRLKTTENPIIEAVVRGDGDHACRGRKLDDALDHGSLRLGSVIDLDAVLRDRRARTASIRIIGVQAPDGETRWYLTNLTREQLSAEEAVIAYAQRWQVELVFKAFKSGLGLDDIRAWKPESVIALVYGKIVGMALARLLELSAHEKAGPHATTQLAVVLTLARLCQRLMLLPFPDRKLDLKSREQALMRIATVVAKSRNQRRERAKRQKLLRMKVDAH